jgi:hypothetical protein
MCDGYVWQFFNCVWFETISLLMSKTMLMSNYDDIMWMSNYKDFMCDGCWNYMLMLKTCCNVFVNVSWYLRMWMRTWIDVCECNCECESVVIADDLLRPSDISYFWRPVRNNLISDPLRPRDTSVVGHKTLSVGNSSDGLGFISDGFGRQKFYLLLLWGPHEPYQLSPPSTPTFRCLAVHLHALNVVCLFMRELGATTM